jgi:hypothetical protein
MGATGTPETGEQNVRTQAMAPMVSSRPNDGSLRSVGTGVVDRNTVASLSAVGAVRRCPDCWKGIVLEVVRYFPGKRTNADYGQGPTTLVRRLLPGADGQIWRSPERHPSPALLNGWGSTKAS